MDAGLFGETQGKCSAAGEKVCDFQREFQVLADERLNPSATWAFDAEIGILTHSTTIQPRYVGLDKRNMKSMGLVLNAGTFVYLTPCVFVCRYQAVIHLGIVRQAAQVVAMDRDNLRSGDRAVVRFRFLGHPE